MRLGKISLGKQREPPKKPTDNYDAALFSLDTAVLMAVALYFMGHDGASVSKS